MSTFPQPTTGGIQPGKTVASSVPGDAASAKQVVLNAAQSSAGRVRLTTQAGNADEVGALALLTGSSDEIGTAAAALLTAAGIAGLTFESTWDAAVTAIANS